MRLIHVIFLLLAAILGLLVALLLIGGPTDASGTAHPLIEGMNIGGDGLARLGGQGGLIFVLQVLMLLLIYCLIALGVAPRLRTGQFWLLLGIGGLLSLAIWWGMYTSYMNFLETGETRILLGYPLPTALMLFGVFLGGSYLCGLYIWGFRRFIYTEADEAAYEALRAEAPSPRQPDSSAGGSDS